MKRYQLSITIFFLLCALLPGFAQQTKTLTLLQTSDTHSRIEPIDVHAADKYAGMGSYYHYQQRVHYQRFSSGGC